MPLELMKDAVTLKQQRGKQSSRILLEGDMIVPDTKPDVKQVLRCKGRIRLQEVKTAEEKVSFRGELVVTILYRAIGGERPIYAMSSALPIQETLYMEGLQKDDTVDLDLELEHLECNLINDRKVGLRAVIEAEAEAEWKANWQMVFGTKENDAELLWSKVLTEQPITDKKDRFTVKNRMTVPHDQPAIGEILDTSVTISNTDIRPMDGKVGIKGNLWVSVLYSDDTNGMPMAVEQEIPFHGFIEANGVTPQSIADVKLSVGETEVTPEVDEDGEPREIAVDVTIYEDLKASKVTEKSFVTDAYGLEQNLKPIQENVTFPMTAGVAQNRFTVKETVRLEENEMPMMQAVRVWGNVQITDAKADTDTVTVEGVLHTEILYLCQDDEMPVCVIHRGFPFTRTIEVKGANAGDTVCVRGTWEEADFRLLTENEGECRIQVMLYAKVLRNQQLTMVTDLQEEEIAENVAQPGAVIVMVQPGDTLWNIAKKYRTTPERILMMNDIENPDRLYVGQKLLILRKNFR